MYSAIVNEIFSITEMNYQKLSTISKMAFLPYKPLAELELNRRYMVNAIRKVSTRFGVRVVVTLNDEFQVFLTNKVSKTLVEHQSFFEEAVADANDSSLFLIYYGDRKYELTKDPMLNEYERALYETQQEDDDNDIPSD